MVKRTKMKNLIIGFILGMVIMILIFINEFIGLNFKALKKLWRILDDK